MKLAFDLPVSFRSGDEGVVADVVVDPTTMSVSHVVVQPGHHAGMARLVSVIDLTPDEKAIGLECARDLDAYPLVESTQFVKLSAPLEIEGDWDVGIERVSALPYFSAEFEEAGYPAYLGRDEEEIGITFHRIPKGTVEIRRSSDVFSVDGARLGRVEGFVVDADQVAHLVLAEGHLWGRHDVVIPVAAVKSFSNDEVRLSLSANEVESLPRPGNVRRP